VALTDLNPQRKQMSDESMVRNLAAQAEAIWPQERELFRRYGLADDVRILDAGCGTGEGASRLAEMFPRAQVLGVDILDHHLELARSRHARFAPRLAFEHRSIFELGLPDRSFDLTVCRHVIQSVPHVDRVLAELVRVTRSGGWLHVIAEDYDMLHFQKGALDPRDFWHEAPARFSEATGTNLFVGRYCAPMLEALGLRDIRVDYVIVDTLRVPPETFARILEAWRDGYVESVAELTRFTEDQACAYFDWMIATIRDPRRYAVWQVPVVSGRVA
jgi:ubiquinone/menaquinone biosynthesis C-methylase UbiE